MKKFLIQLSRFSLIGIIPILILLIGYFWLDPFKVLKQYDNYSGSYVISDRDYISTEMLIRNYSKYHYNSFIFGSSRTLAYQADTWHQYLDPTDKPFAFDASCESIDGIYNKLRYLDSKNIPIKNALFILCRDVTFSPTKDYNGHLYAQHPITSRESKISFHWKFLKAYFAPKFLFNFYCYKIIGSYKPFMLGFIDARPSQFDKITNQIDVADKEREIANNPKAYYQNHRGIFYARNGEQADSLRRINAHQQLIIRKMKQILDRNKTNYKVVVSPLYEQVKFSNPDLSILKSAFQNHLYDFSGKNKWTDSKTNYYETNHYRPFVGDSILAIIYK